MAKPGDEYRELVGVIMSALDPGSAVKTEQWIEGPDGERDMDVEVRGTLGGAPHFVLVECKDHARPIGIGYVDAFESKIRDLQPDRAIMFSNSGFSRDALRKASRVGIEMASALKAGDATVKIQVHRELTASRVTLSLRAVHLYPFGGQAPELDESWAINELSFDGLSLAGWINEKMKLAAEDGRTGPTLFLCTFRDVPSWSYRGRPLSVGALKVEFEVTRASVAQSVRTDASLGYYDHLQKAVVVPDKQWYSLGDIDNDAWEVTEQESKREAPQPNSFKIDLTLVRTTCVSSGPVPNVDQAIAESRLQSA